MRYNLTGPLQLVWFWKCLVPGTSYLTEISKDTLGSRKLSSPCSGEHRGGPESGPWETSRWLQYLQRFLVWNPGHGPRKMLKKWSNTFNIIQLLDTFEVLKVKSVFNVPHSLTSSGSESKKSRELGVNMFSAQRFKVGKAIVIAPSHVIISLTTMFTCSVRRWVF